MVTTTLDIIVQMNIQAAKAELTKLRYIVNRLNNRDLDPKSKIYKYKGLRKSMQLANKAKDELGRNSPITKEANARVKRMADDLKISARGMAIMRDRTKEFNFNFLSLMFAGMMIKKYIGKIFTSIIDNYKKITGLNSQFTKDLLKLRASFGYLKFAIANSLNSPGITRIIEWFTDKIVMLGDYMSEHPGMSQALLGIAAGLIAIGNVAIAASMVIQIDKMFGIFATWGKSIAGLFSKKSLTELSSRITNLKKVMLNFKDWVSDNWKGIAVTGLNLAGLTLSTSELIKSMKTKNLAAMLGNAIATGLYLAGALVATFNPALGLALFIAGTAILGITKITTKIKQKKDVIKELGITKEMVDSQARKLALERDVGIRFNIRGLRGEFEEKLAMKKLLPLYKTTSDKLNNINSILQNTSDMSSSQIENYLIKQKELQDKLADYTRYGTILNETEFNEYVSTINAKKQADDIYASNLKNNIDSQKKNYDDLNTSMTIINLDADGLLNNQKTMNALVSDANDIVPTYTENLKLSIKQTLLQSDATNKAAAAQERYNRAVQNHSTHGSSAPGHTTIPINQQSMSIAPSLSTSTQTGGVYFNSSGQGFSSAFGNPNGD